MLEPPGPYRAASGQHESAAVSPNRSVITHRATGHVAGNGANATEGRIGPMLSAR